MEFVETLREHELTLNVPVIVLTAQVLTEADMARLNRGVTTVLEKGMFSVEETLEHMESVLARNRKLGNGTQRLIRRAVAYIHEHYAEQISRDDLAHHLGVNKDYLTRCFSQEMGISLVTYLNRYRVNHAKIMLAMGTKSVTEVAAAVGFSDSNYFSRVFRREAGISPRAYGQS